MYKRTIIALCLLAGTTGQGIAQETRAAYAPSAENLAAREWFQDARFGMFIHWGIYSMLGSGEWVLEQRGIEEKEYQRLAAGFYPSRFDAGEWVAAARRAGMKYICITSRHHDGFSMFGTRQSAYNVVDATPFGRDVIAELAGACRREGIKLFFYYSHLDWHRGDYLPTGRTGKKTGRVQEGSWEEYRAFTDAQLMELLTRYGPVGGIWFDGWWDKPGADWRLEEQYALIHSLQPACLVGNNHHVAPFAGEDFQMFERDIPGQNTAGYSADAPVSALPLETCQTMNKSWGYSITDRDYKSPAEIIKLLVRAAGNNANLLLNVGPRPDGQIPEEATRRLEEVGKWLERYGETIRGTRAGDLPPAPWGVTTRRGNVLYVHVLQREGDTLFLPLEARRVKRVTLHEDGTPVKYARSPGGITLYTTAPPADTPDQVFRVELKR
jgi:alpha-L-fucosidase